MDKNEEIKNQECGYIEGNSAFAQQEAGFGCRLVFEDINAEDAFTSERETWVNGSAKDVPMFGKKIQFMESQTDELIDAIEDSEDISE